MLKKILLFIFSFFVVIVLVWVEVDVNKVDQVVLDGVCGIGFLMFKCILEEWQKGGVFKDWVDLEKCVKGIKDKVVVKLFVNGLIVNGQVKMGVVVLVVKEGKVLCVENKGKEGVVKFGKNDDKMVEKGVDKVQDKVGGK